MSVLISGHGPTASDPQKTARATLGYLHFTREKMRAAVDEMIPFADAHQETGWSELAHLPAFGAARRCNADGTHLSFEQESSEDEYTRRIWVLR